MPPDPSAVYAHRGTPAIQRMVEYAPATGSLALWVRHRDIDDGDGIPAEDAVHIFDPYFRAHNAAGQPSSVGLGLTVSRKLAQLMGGDLTYRYEDAAAVFRLELPAAGKVHGATGHGRGGNASAS